MNKTGRLIAIEGIDGSGKRTQVELLAKALAARGFQTYLTGFPQYDSWFGKMVGQFLNGEFGRLDEVDPHFTAMLYAGDRFEAKTTIQEALSSGKIVLADRYIASNLAHQTARISPEERAEFIQWTEHLEYEIYELPVEDLVLYLRVPAAEAQKLIERKSERAYTSAKQDLQEASIHHLEDAAKIYDRLSKRASWVSVECFNAFAQAMRPSAEISAEIFRAVEPLLNSLAPQEAR
jgi:dTMP kinase